MSRITQETFDDAVRENMEEFDMPREEAVRDAVSQFQSQGVDLSSVVTAAEGLPAWLVQLRELRALQEAGSVTDANEEQVLAGMAAVREACSRGNAQEKHRARSQAGAMGAVPLLLVLSLGEGRPAVVKAACATARAVCKDHYDNRDAFGADGVESMLSPAAAALSAGARDVAAAMLAVVRVVTTRAEANKKAAMQHGAPDLVLAALADPEAPRALLREAAGAMRAITTADDQRAEFPDAVNNAGEFVEKGGVATVLAAARGRLAAGDAEVLAALLSTFRVLVVNEQACRQLVDGQGVEFLAQCNEAHGDSPMVVRQVLSAYRNLAGIDEHKALLVREGAIEITLAALERHLGELTVVEAGAAALAAFALREPGNCDRIWRYGIETENVAANGGSGAGGAAEGEKEQDEAEEDEDPENDDFDDARYPAGGFAVLIGCLRRHRNSGDDPTLRAICLAVRNLVARKTELRKNMLAGGVKELLIAVSTTPGVNDEAYAALRDLRVKMTLRGDRDDFEQPARPLVFNPSFEPSTDDW